MASNAIFVIALDGAVPDAPFSCPDLENYSRFAHVATAFDAATRQVHYRGEINAWPRIAGSPAYAGSRSIGGATVLATLITRPGTVRVGNYMLTPASRT